MPVAPVAERGYANPNLLSDTDWLAAHLDDANLRIIDTRSAELYEAGHIPGAISLVAHGGIPRSPANDMGTPEQFADLAGRMGIANDSTVVIYDVPAAAMGMAAWAFSMYGHADVRILDGGFTKWTAENRPVATEPASFEPTTYEATYVESMDCPLDYAKSAVGQPDVIFWDTRTLAEHEGTQGNNPRMGHITGSIHLEWIDLLDPETKTLKPADELRLLLNSRGITPESEINCY
jgi:thiosulfate/3-mercaptopyruvate sulfurtransferase